jgi:hypothetical protein
MYGSGSGGLERRRGPQPQLVGSRRCLLSLESRPVVPSRRRERDSELQVVGETVECVKGPKVPGRDEEEKSETKRQGIKSGRERRLTWPPSL